MMAKRIVIIITIAALLAPALAWAGKNNEQEKYNPNPIVFVHGFNNVNVKNENLWKVTRKNFMRYFKQFHPSGKDLGFKYSKEDIRDYMAVFDWTKESNGDIDNAADGLKNFIDDVIDSLPDGQEKKCIIVAHSAGGIAIKRALAKYKEEKDKDGLTLQDKIRRVVFIGTPHEGSPLATGVILIDRLIPELTKVKTQDNKFVHCDRSLDLAWQYLANKIKHWIINGKLKDFLTVVNDKGIKSMLDGYDAAYDPYKPHNKGQDVAIGQLVVPANISATIGVVAESPTKYGVVKFEWSSLKSSYDKSDTFLNANSFEVPADFKAIVGTMTVKEELEFLGTCVALISYLVAPELTLFAVAREIAEHLCFKVLMSLSKPTGLLFALEADFLGLPNGFTFKDLDNDSDEVVTVASQIALGSNAEDIQKVMATHTSEPDQWMAIRDAIDDTPIIEFIRPGGAFTNNTENYIIVKVKDYFLNDINIETAVFDEQVLNWIGYLEEFRAPWPGGDLDCKPFYKYYKRNQKFSEERISEEAAGKKKFHLKPGEFVVRVPPADEYATHYFYLMIGNAAGRKAAAYLFFPEKKCVGKGVTFIPCEYVEKEAYRAIRDNIYSEFCGTDKSVFDFAWYVGRSGEMTGRAIYPLEYDINAWHFFARMGEFYSIWLNFDLGNRGLGDPNVYPNIRSARFIYNFYKVMPGGASDYTLSVLRDVDNASWPPTPEAEAELSLCDIDTGSLPQATVQYPNTTINIDLSISNYKDVAINLGGIDWNGQNIVQIRPSQPFPEDPQNPAHNFLPIPSFTLGEIQGHPWSIASGYFDQLMALSADYPPCLFIELEVNNKN